MAITQFRREDPFHFDGQSSDDERAVRDAAHATAARFALGGVGRLFTPTRRASRQMTPHVR